MKIKGDFITNSSTSCYVMYAFRFKNDINNIPDVLWEMFFSDNKQYKPEDLKIEDDHYVLINEAIWKCWSLSSLCDPEYPYICLGGALNEMEGNETLNQFKERIVNELQKLGFNATIDDLVYIEEAIYN